MFIGFWAKQKPSLKTAFSISPVPFIPSLWTFCQFILEELNIFIMNQMLVTGVRLMTLEEEAWSAHVPHTEMTKRRVMCVERFIVKLSTGTSLASREWFKIRHNLEAFQSQKGVSSCWCSLLLLPLVEVNWSSYSNAVYSYAERVACGILLPLFCAISTLESLWALELKDILKIT